MMKVVMKKLALAVLLAIPALAVAEGGYYIQGDVGFSRPTIERTGVYLSDNAISFGVTVGKQVRDDVRFAVDYAYLGNNKIKANNGTTEVDLKLHQHSLGVLSIYDFPSDTQLRPYLGVRASSNLIHGGGSYNGQQASENQIKLGIGAVAGVQYQLSNNMALDGGIEYNHLGTFYNSKMSQYGLSVGLRHNFE